MHQALRTMGLPLRRSISILCRGLPTRLPLNHQVQRFKATQGSAPSRQTILSEMLFYSPVQVLTGLALGGLGATCGALVFFLHNQEIIDAKDMLSGLQHYRLVLEKDGSLDVLSESDMAKPKAKQSAWVTIPVTLLAPGVYLGYCCLCKPFTHNHFLTFLFNMFCRRLTHF
eukprot:m.146184 g.146184  ORF g.146184 m.146184 type:complete len:171 (+) comp16232_c0_seq2:57-569(+)